MTQPLRRVLDHGAWRARAQCKGSTELFYSSERADMKRAKAVCGTCPVATQCLDTAITNREPAGVWGGVVFYDGKAAQLEHERAKAS